MRSSSASGRARGSAHKPAAHDVRGGCSRLRRREHRDGLHRRADLREGRSILVYGASGSIGTAAVQLAKSFGAHVTAVCDTKHVELVASLGADEVVDYLQEDFTKNGKTYDVIFDAVGKHSFRRCRRSLKPGGTYSRPTSASCGMCPLLALLTRMVGEKKVTLPTPKYSKRGRLVPEGAHRRREVPRSHRSVVPARAGGRGDAIRRDRAEDGQRRPRRQRRLIADEAAVRTRYGTPDVVELREVEMPDLVDEGVLVRVRAASINPADWYGLTGRPWVARAELGLRGPKTDRLGVDFAGTVEAVGKDVTQFRPGDEVFGGKSGALAEYICVPRCRRAEAGERDAGTGGCRAGCGGDRAAGSSRQGTSAGRATRC